jgi:hypothetical protein
MVAAILTLQRGNERGRRMVAGCALRYDDAVRSGEGMREDRVIIEFLPQGRFVKVSAMDPQTLTEVTIVGDAARGEEQLKRAALNKLRYVLERDGGGRGPARR